MRGHPDYYMGARGYIGVAVIRTASTPRDERKETSCGTGRQHGQSGLVSGSAVNGHELWHCAETRHFDHMPPYRVRECCLALVGLLVAGAAL